MARKRKRDRRNRPVIDWIKGIDKDDVLAAAIAASGVVSPTTIVNVGGIPGFVNYAFHHELKKGNPWGLKPSTAILHTIEEKKIRKWLKDGVKPWKSDVNPVSNVPEILVLQENKPQPMEIPPVPNMNVLSWPGDLKSKEETPPKPPQSEPVTSPVRPVQSPSVTCSS